MKKIIIFDFDGTITPSSLPSPGILKQCGIDSRILNFKLLNRLKFRIAGSNEAFCKTLYKMFLAVIKLKNRELKDADLCMGADTLKYNKGIEDFLESCQEKSVLCYLLSSDMEVYLKSTKISSYFEDIIGTTFEYDESDNVVGVKHLMYDKAKVNSIKEILRENAQDDCSNVVYFGDGLTDYPAMEFVKNNGGQVVFISHSQNGIFAKYALQNGLVDMFSKPDYSSDSEIARYIDKFIEGPDKQLPKF